MVFAPQSAPLPHLPDLCFGSSNLEALPLAGVAKKTEASSTPAPQSVSDFTREEQTASIFHSASSLICRS